MWDDLSGTLASDFTVLRVDLPGHGESGSLNYIHTMDDMAEALRAIILQEKIQNPVMIGHSMGGYVALAYAEKYGAELSGLGLFHSTGFADSEEKKADRSRAIEAVMKHPELFAEMTIPNLFNPERREELKLPIDEAIHMARSQPVQGIVANLRGMMERPDRSEVFRKIAVPKLLVHGMQDPVLSTEGAELMCENVADVTSVFLDGVGHMGHIEAPVEVEKCFMDLMKKCRHV